MQMRVPNHEVQLELHVIKTGFFYFWSFL